VSPEDLLRAALLERFLDALTSCRHLTPETFFGGRSVPEGTIELARIFAARRRSGEVDARGPRTEFPDFD
jgi:hypothetical protein